MVKLDILQLIHSKDKKITIPLIKCLDQDAYCEILV